MMMICTPVAAAVKMNAQVTLADINDTVTSDDENSS